MLRLSGWPICAGTPFYCAGENQYKLAGIYEFDAPRSRSLIPVPASRSACSLSDLAICTIIENPT
jgi:hypothetical protein